MHGARHGRTQGGCTRLHVQGHTHTCMHTPVHTHTHPCMHAHTRVCTRTWPALMFAAPVHAHCWAVHTRAVVKLVHTRAHTHVHALLCKQASGACTHMCMCSRASIWCMHSCTHTHVHAHTLLCKHLVHAHLYTCTCSCAHTHTRCKQASGACTLVHTCMRSCACICTPMHTLVHTLVHAQRRCTLAPCSLCAPLRPLAPCPPAVPGPPVPPRRAEPLSFCLAAPFEGPRALKGAEVLTQTAAASGQGRWGGDGDPGPKALEGARGS